MEKILTGKKTASWRDQFISNNNYAVKVIQRIIIEFSSHGNENGGGGGDKQIAKNTRKGKNYATTHFAGVYERKLGVPAKSIFF